MRLLACNETVTLVRHAQETGKDLYTCEAIVGVSWFAKAGTSPGSTGETPKAELVVRIPEELAPDPLNEDISEALSEVRFGRPESAKACLKGILSRESLFGVNLYRAGLGEKIEEMFRQMTAGPGAALKTVEQWIG